MGAYKPYLGGFNHFFLRRTECCFCVNLGNGASAPFIEKLKGGPGCGAEGTVYPPPAPPRGGATTWTGLWRRRTNRTDPDGPSRLLGWARPTGGALYGIGIALCSPPASSGLQR